MKKLQLPLRALAISGAMSALVAPTFAMEERADEGKDLLGGPTTSLLGQNSVYDENDLKSVVETLQNLHKEKDNLSKEKDDLIKEIEALKNALEVEKALSSFNSEEASLRLAKAEELLRENEQLKIKLQVAHIDLSEAYQSENEQLKIKLQVADIDLSEAYQKIVQLSDKLELQEARVSQLSDKLELQEAKFSDEKNITHLHQKYSKEILNLTKKNEEYFEKIQRDQRDLSTLQNLKDLLKDKNLEIEALKARLRAGDEKEKDKQLAEKDKETSKLKDEIELLEIQKNEQLEQKDNEIDALKAELEALKNQNKS